MKQNIEQLKIQLWGTCIDDEVTTMENELKHKLKILGEMQDEN